MPQRRCPYCNRWVVFRMNADETEKEVKCFSCNQPIVITRLSSSHAHPAPPKTEAPKKEGLTFVQMLVNRKVAMLLVPPGAGKEGLGRVVGALGDPKQIGEAVRRAQDWVAGAIAAVKWAPDNPYGEDDEAIAKAILAATLKKEQEKRGPVRG